jgi:hypothetical protein
MTFSRLQLVFTSAIQSSTIRPYSSTVRLGVAPIQRSTLKRSSSTRSPEASVVGGAPSEPIMLPSSLNSCVSSAWVFQTSSLMGGGEAYSKAFTPGRAFTSRISAGLLVMSVSARPEAISTIIFGLVTMFRCSRICAQPRFMVRWIGFSISCGVVPLGRPGRRTKSKQRIGLV